MIIKRHTKRGRLFHVLAPEKQHHAAFLLEDTSPIVTGNMGLSQWKDQVRSQVSIV